MKLREEKLPRFVELVRVSSMGQAKKDTPERQRHELDRSRETHSGVLVERIEASGVSGTLPLAESREGRRLIELAGKFDELRVVHVSRVFGARSGDPADQVAVASLCYKAAALIVTTEGRRYDPRNPIDMMQLAIECAIASKDRTDHLLKTNQGRLSAVRMGRSPGGVRYFGRRFDRSAGQWIIHQPERSAFDQIKAWLYGGMTANEMCRRLNATRVPTVSGTGSWFGRTLMRLLRMRHLVGESEIRNKHCPGEVVLLKIPALVTEQEFERIQELIDARRPVGRPASPTVTTMCGGRIFCPCGLRMYSRKKRNARFYYCASGSSDARNAKRQRCPHYKFHRADFVDTAVWESIAANVEGDLLADATGETPDVSGYREELARCEKLLSDLADREKDITAAYRRRRLSKDTWESELDDISTDRRTLEKSRRVAADAVARFEKSNVSRESVQVAVKALRGKLKTASIDDRRELVQALIPNEKGYGITVQVDGQITIDAGLSAQLANESVGEVAGLAGETGGAKVQRSS